MMGSHVTNKICLLKIDISYCCDYLLHEDIKYLITSGSVT